MDDIIYLHDVILIEDLRKCSVNSYFEILCDDIIINIFKYLTREDFFRIRAVSKSFIRISENEIFWRVINFTNIGTDDLDKIYESFKNNDYLQIYNLSQEDTVALTIPTSIVKNLFKSKLIII